LFDLDNTLVDRAGAFRRSVERLQHDLGTESPDFVKFVVDADQDGAAGWLSWMRAAQERFGFGGDVAALVEEHHRRYLESFTVEPDVVEALHELHANGWRVVIVTNGPPTQLEVAQRCGVLHAVDDCLVSAVVGVRKPDPAIFVLAAQRVGADLGHDTAWMVGDNPSADIGGAVAVGIGSIWISRGRRWTEPSFAPTETVDVIAEAFDRLAGAHDVDRAGS
jgi:putative hydrolase of the HAD superfamily